MKKIFILAIIVALFLNLGNFLDVTRKPLKSDLIVCLGGGGVERINTAIDLYDKNYSIKNDFLLMGDRHQAEWKIRANKKLYKKIKNINMSYTKKFKNTMEELKYIGEYMKLKHYKSILIVTDPYHSRRVKLLIQTFKKNLNFFSTYTIASSGLKWWNKYLFFLNEKSIIVSITEYAKIVYNFLKYSLPRNNIIFRNLDKLSRIIKEYTYSQYGIY